MRVVAINGSPKKDGNTYKAISMVAEELKKDGIETEIIHIGNQLIRGCLGCGGCAKNKDEKCVIKEDSVNEWIQIIKDADGVILGSPVYYSGIPGTMKSFLDRAFYVAGVNGSLFRHKVGAAVVADRRSGGVSTFTQLNNFLNYSEMIMPTSNYWNVIFGRAPGEVEKDQEGKQIMSVLGKNMGWVMKMKKESALKGEIKPPEKVKKEYMSFIR